MGQQWGSDDMMGVEEWMDAEKSYGRALSVLSYAALSAVVRGMKRTGSCMKENGMELLLI